MKDVCLINDCLLSDLQEQARNNMRLRQHWDLRNSAKDGSQRMLNYLMPGTKMPIHRHEGTSETVICLEGCIEWIFYEEQTGQVQEDERFVEIARYRVCPRDKVYGIQVPDMAWHSIEVLEPSCVFEAKDGTY